MFKKIVLFSAHVMNSSSDVCVHLVCFCAHVTAHDCGVYECVPVLAVLSVVTVLTVTDISVRGAGLPVTLCLILTWVQLTCIHTAFTIKSCI